MSEADWLARARAGDEAAFRALYESLRGRVFRLCLQLCGERSLAEDAMQNAFLAAHRGLRTFRGEARVSTWIYRIAIREALALRSRAPPSGESLEAAARIASPEAPADAQVAVRERARKTQAALRGLSAEHQAVLSLFAVEGLRHAEIAAVLGVPEGTVWSRLSEARRALRARVDGAA